MRAAFLTLLAAALASSGSIDQEDYGSCPIPATSLLQLRRQKVETIYPLSSFSSKPASDCVALDHELVIYAVQRTLHIQHMVSGGHNEFTVRAPSRGLSGDVRADMSTFGTSCDVDADAGIVVVGAPDVALVYERRRDSNDGDEWRLRHELTIPRADAQAFGQHFGFGWTVAAAGDLVLVGYPAKGQLLSFRDEQLIDVVRNVGGWDVASTRTHVVVGDPVNSRAHVLARRDAKWERVMLVTDEPRTLFGFRVAAAEPLLASDARHQIVLAVSALVDGTVHVFAKGDRDWRRLTSVKSPDSTSTNAIHVQMYPTSGGPGPDTDEGIHEQDSARANLLEIFKEGRGSLHNRFGHSIAISTDMLLVGGARSGQAIVFAFDPNGAEPTVVHPAQGHFGSFRQIAASNSVAALGEYIQGDVVYAVQFLQLEPAERLSNKTAATGDSVALTSKNNILAPSSIATETETDVAGTTDEEVNAVAVKQEEACDATGLVRGKGFCHLASGEALHWIVEQAGRPVDKVGIPCTFDLGDANAQSCCGRFIAEVLACCKDEPTFPLDGFLESYGALQCNALTGPSAAGLPAASGEPVVAAKHCTFLGLDFACPH